MEAMKRAVLVALILLSLCGCIRNKQPKLTKEEIARGVEVYRVDVDSDSIKEIVRIDPEANGTKDGCVQIIKKNPRDSRTFEIPGKIIKTELIELNWDSCQQVAVTYEDKDLNTNLVIYGFKNKKLSKLFYINSKCSIETDSDSDSPLFRVKVGRPKPGLESCSSKSDTDWSSWVWDGERFILE